VPTRVRRLGATLAEVTEWPSSLEVVRSLRVPILVNDYERAVDSQLASVFGRSGRRVHCKPRLADVLPVNDGSLGQADRSYALCAHFDFVVTDEEGLAELAVEFDGPLHHSDPVTIRRDERKERICREFMLPLLRIGASAFRPVDERTLLEWMLQVCMAYSKLRDAWAEVHDTEERGEDWVYDLPDFTLEEFDYRTYGGCPSPDDKTGRMIVAPLDVFHSVRKRIGQSVVLKHRNHESWYGTQGRNTVGHFALQVDDSAWVLGTGRVNLRGLYPWVGGLLPPRVAQDVALLDLDRQLDGWERGKLRAMSWEGIVATVAGCREGLLTRYEMPSRHERANAVLHTLRGWSIDTDDPRVQAKVYLSMSSKDDEWSRWDEDD
jgi:hypothetical protein